MSAAPTGRLCAARWSAARSFVAVEGLAIAVSLPDEEGLGLGALEGREALPAGRALATPANRGAALGASALEDARVLSTGGTIHRHSLLALVATPKNSNAISRGTFSGADPGDPGPRRGSPSSSGARARVRCAPRIGLSARSFRPEPASGRSGLSPTSRARLSCGHGPTGRGPGTVAPRPDRDRSRRRRRRPGRRRRAAERRPRRGGAPDLDRAGERGRGRRRGRGQDRRGEARLRGVSHQWAFFVSLVAGAALVVAAQTPRATVAMAIYAVSLSALLGNERPLSPGHLGARPRRWMRRLDHSMIFLLIAGTYTPFALLVLHGDAGEARPDRRLGRRRRRDRARAWSGWTHRSGSARSIYLSTAGSRSRAFPGSWAAIGPVGVGPDRRSAAPLHRGRGGLRAPAPGPATRRSSATTRSSTCS